MTLRFMRNTRVLPGAARLIRQAGGVVLHSTCSGDVVGLPVDVIRLVVAHTSAPEDRDLVLATGGVLSFTTTPGSHTVVQEVFYVEPDQR